MKKVWTVARREYLFNLKRRSFLFAVFGVPIFTFVMWFIIFALVANNEEDISQVGKVGYVDQAGVLIDAVYPEPDTDLFVPYELQDVARTALDAKTIGAYFVIPSDYMTTGAIDMYSYSGIPEALDVQH